MNSLNRLFLPAAVFKLPEVCVCEQRERTSHWNSKGIDKSPVTHYIPIPCGVLIRGGLIPSTKLIVTNSLYWLPHTFRFRTLASEPLNRTLSLKGRLFGKSAYWKDLTLPLCQTTLVSNLSAAPHTWPLCWVTQSLRNYMLSSQNLTKPSTFRGLGGKRSRVHVHTSYRTHWESGVL